jgi:hypothetical protein
MRREVTWLQACPRLTEQPARMGTALKMLLMVSLLFTFGCASLPDVNRIQGNMDAMVHYMGIMAGSMPVMVNSTSRMADTAERMQQKSDALLASIEKKGGTAERAIQNYSQAVLDNERGVISSLKGIRQELGDLKHGLPPSASGASVGPKDQDKINEALQARLGALEARLTAIASKMEKLDGAPPR